MHDTAYQPYEKILQECQQLFSQKTQDYGTSWRILRLPSITDQIMIKAKRIRTIQETGASRIPEGIPIELMGIINYSIIALLQLSLPQEASLSLSYQDLEPYYAKIVKDIKTLFSNKDQDYASAWKQMRFNSIVDIILMKLLRIQSIEEQDGKALFSEGIEANYQDIINYAIFGWLKLKKLDHEWI